MKCNDCGESIVEAGTHKREDICIPCWKTRLELVEGKIVACGTPEFKKIQRKMAGGRGTAKRYIDSLMEPLDQSGRPPYECPCDQCEGRL